MTIKEMRLSAQLLRLAADEFSNHGCNDWEWPTDWTVEEKRAFVRAFHDWNGDPEEYDPNRLYLADFCVMAFLAHKLTDGLPPEELMIP